MTQKTSEAFDSLLRAAADSPSIPVLPPDGILAGRFELRRLLGQGGFGIVYEAEDRQDGQRVALKLMRHGAPSWLRRFKREFRALQGIVHPNLVALHELFFVDGHWFFTMDLVNGVDFLTHVRAGRKAAADPDFARLRSALRQLLEGLAVLHAEGQVHRDVKPSNVLVDTEGRVVLLDFGLAVSPEAATADDVSARSGIVGTPLYMAPEQAAGHAVGGPADLYAVGVMLYEALTGRPPYAGAVLEVLTQKQSKKPLAPSAVAPGVPPDLDRLCLDLMRHDSAARSSAAQILAGLAPGERGSPVSARMPAARSRSAGGVGRAAELDLLRQAAHSAFGGDLATVMLVGESGIGKSNLMRRFVEHVVAEVPTVVVLNGRCCEGEAIPYKGLDGVVESLAKRLTAMRYDEIEALLPARMGSLVRVFPAMQPVASAVGASLACPADARELRRQAFSSLRELLTRVAVRQPTVVAVEDLHWVDDDGLRGFAGILRGPDAPPVLFVGTRRAPGLVAGNALFEAAPPDTRWVELHPLPKSDATALAASVLRACGANEESASRVASEAGGHPLFIEELARHAAARGVESPGVRFEEAVAARMAALDPAARAVAEVVLTADKPLPREIAGIAAEIDPRDLHRAIAALSASSFIRAAPSTTGRIVEPYHDRVRLAVAMRITPERRRAIHERCATAFEGRADRDPEQLALHWHGAENGARAAAYAAQAADGASRTYAFERAARWYELALEWLPEDDDSRGGLHLRLAEAFALAGHGARAADHFEAAALTAPLSEARILKRRAAEQLLRNGHFDRGIAASRVALEAVGLSLHTDRIRVLLSIVLYRWRLWFYRLAPRRRSPQARPPSALELARIDTCWFIGYTLLFVDPFIGQVLEMRALLMSLAIGDVDRAARGVGVELAMTAAAGEGARERVRTLMAAASDLAAQAGSVDAQWYLRASYGASLLLLGQFRRAVDELEGARSLSSDGSPGLSWERASSRVVIISALVVLGRFRDLCKIQEEGLRDAEDRGDRWAFVTMQMADASIAWLVSDQPELVEENAQRALRDWPTSGFHVEHHATLLARVLGRLYVGDADAAHALACELTRRGRRSLMGYLQIVRIKATYLQGVSALARLERGSGDRRKLLRAVARDAKAIARERATWAAGFVSTLRAGHALYAEHSPQARETAIALLRRAAEQYNAADMIGYAVTVRYHAARLEGGPDSARVVAECVAHFVAETARAPERFMAMYVPGFSRAGVV